jgi:hypothetical protein
MNYPAERMAPAPSPTRLGQGTAVEQSRAVAEVQAAIVVAQQCPRDINAAIAEMRQSCSQMYLAEKASFRFPRGGQQVSGPSVHLARELARCWGNIQYGLVEMRRDDEYGESEMQAFAWDVQKNSRNSSTFIVPHKRDQKGGPKKLDDMRDIYENNANNGARRVREAIFAILPPWFVEEAKELCAKTLRDGGGKPLNLRIADTIKAFENIGVTLDRIETKLGRLSGKWTEHDVAQLVTIGKSISQGEVTADDEFPLPRVTVEEIRQQATPRTAQKARDDLHTWDIHQIAASLGMSPGDLEERCHGVTGGPLSDASEAQIRSLTQELASEMVTRDSRVRAAGGAE